MICDGLPSAETRLVATSDASERRVKESNIQNFGGRPTPSSGRKKTRITPSRTKMRVTTATGEGLLQ